ncbi:MAG: DUF1553 domain-containing protein [Bryobacteraceae bacterium]|nr:DUF1553 domain-containing protein [Bryobacteraceae bacterium]
MRRRLCGVASALLAIVCSGMAEVDKELAFIGSRGKYWAFQKVVRPIPPPVVSAWIKTPIDAFILKGLTDVRLAPSPALDRIQLIRRVTYDLTGLPPAPGEVALFLADRSPDAYEKVVDRLLASPHYGERWATKWLDTVRYADTNGFELDLDRPHAWRYRDYVIGSFNNDKPFTRFIEEQIAGDEMFPGSDEALVATGYLRAGSEHIVAGNIDPAESRQEVLTEIATNIGQTFLGLTVNCARCHNHKFDPVLQADFYRLQAVFAGAKGKNVEIVKADRKAEWETADALYKARLKPIQDALQELAKPYGDMIREESKAKLDPALLMALGVPKDKRTPEQQVLAKNAEVQIKPAWDEIVARMPADVMANRARLREQLHDIEFTAPDPLPTAYAFVNTGEPAEQSHVLRLGEAHARLDPVEPSVPRVLQGNFEFSTASPGRRTALAKWLASPSNPLTARVMANRVWQFRMGTGLVRTPNDFGLMGDKPKDRALLDWLASEFVEQGWSIKRLDRQIVMSNVYRQAAASDGVRAKVDPDNRLYWRMNRKRFEAETIRDAALSVSGTLNTQIGGKPVRIPIEPEVYDLIFTEYERDGLWPVHPDKRVQNRRSIYLYNKRSVRLPLLSAFDQPDAITSCPVRPVSTHALQALSLFNSTFMHEVAKDFAERLTNSCGNNRPCAIRQAWQSALSRPPRVKEEKLARSFLKSGGTLQEFCLAMLNRNEFLYVP